MSEDDYIGIVIILLVASLFVICATVSAMAIIDAFRN